MFVVYLSETVLVILEIVLVILYVSQSYSRIDLILQLNILSLWEAWPKRVRNSQNPTMQASSGCMLQQCSRSHRPGTSTYSCLSSA